MARHPDDLSALYTHTRWRRAAHAYLRANPVCQAARGGRQHEEGCRGLAQVVDHIVPRSAGGSTWDRANWQGLSKPCHDAKTRREQGWGDHKRDRAARQPGRLSHLHTRHPSSVVTADYTAPGAPLRFVHVVGQPGAGKSALAERLAADLGLPVIDIARQPGHLTRPGVAWRALLAAMDAAGRAIVETAGTSRYESELPQSEMMTIAVEAPDDVRRSRLTARPEAARERGYVTRMLAIPAPVAARTWDGQASFDAPPYRTLLRAVREALDVSPARMAG